MLTAATGSAGVVITTFASGCVRMRGVASGTDPRALSFDVKVSRLSQQLLTQRALEEVRPHAGPRREQCGCPSDEPRLAEPGHGRAAVHTGARGSSL